MGCKKIFDGRKLTTMPVLEIKENNVYINSFFRIIYTGKVFQE